MSHPKSPLASPLLRVNSSAASLPTKLNASWEQLCTQPALFAGQDKAYPARFFAELFCLQVKAGVVLAALDKLSLQDLMGSYKNNMTQIFTAAVQALKESERDDTRRDNVVETLIPFLRNILSRPYTNFSLDIMTLLCGSVERSDAVFTDLVSAIDLTLADIFSHTELRHRTLQLALVIVASVNQGSINAFFLRRDLFSTLIKFLSDPATSPFAFESALLLGLLASFRKYEARNPYLVRIEDLVEEAVMERIIEVTTGICTHTRDAYTAIVNDIPPSFVASLTSLLFSFRLSDVLSSFAVSLPPSPQPTPSLRKGKGKEIVADNSTSSTPAVTNGTTSENESTAAATKPNGVANSVKRDAKEESAFKLMPPELAVILLPFYELLNSNKAFAALVFAETSDGPSPLPPALISLSSYIFCHAAISERARAYARLSLIILTILVEEGEEKLNTAQVPIRLCRQRIPSLVYNDVPRSLPAAMLDSAVIFLRHNLSKRLDSEAYICALRLVQRIMQQLKAERIRLGGFHLMKSTLVTILTFLCLLIIIVLSYACYWGESFFPSTKDSVLLHYELLHADSVLDQLSDLLGITTSASHSPDPSSIATSPAKSLTLTPRNTLFSTLSPRRAQFGSAIDGTPSFNATECIANIRASISFFTARIEERRTAVGGEDDFDADFLLNVIEANLGSLTLLDAAAMADLRRYSELGHESFFKGFSSTACADVLALVPVE